MTGEPQGQPRTRCGGFTLLELLTAMIVLSILGGVAIPSLQSAVDRASARKVLTDVSAIRVAVYEYREDSARLPTRAGWGELPPDLANYLNNVDFRYKELEYRLVSNARRGRVDVIVRYPRNHPMRRALAPFARAGVDSGSITVTRARARFRLLENGQ
jgi:prepilin-type N-terminal cleavage/methylation domain-containing protein